MPTGLPRRATGHFGAMGSVAFRVVSATATACVCLSAAGCASGHAQTVNATAVSFYTALEAERGTVACALLAPETKSELEQSSNQPCDQAILEEAVTNVGDRRHTEVFGTMAQVRYAGDVAFLAQFDDGWKVMAAACEPVPGQPYDCSVEGG